MRTRSSSHSHVLTLSSSMVMPQRRGGGGCGWDVWARQIRVFIERSYGMTEESHYLLIKYWSWAVQVLTSKLIWTDPWDQWLGVCVCFCVCMCVWLNEKTQNNDRVREKKGVCLKVWQAGGAGAKEIITIKADGERHRLKFEMTWRQSMERVDCEKRKWNELEC